MFIIFSVETEQKNNYKTTYGPTFGCDPLWGRTDQIFFLYNKTGMRVYLDKWFNH